MANISLTQHIREIELHIGAIITAYDIDSLEAAERDTFATIKRLLIDARLDVRDYEYADSRSEQLICATTGKRRLEQLRKNVLQASEKGLLWELLVCWRSCISLLLFGIP